MTDEQRWLQQQANLLLAALPMSPEKAIIVCQVTIKLLQWQLNGGGFT